MNYRYKYSIINNNNFERIQNLFLQAIGSSGGLTAEQRLQLSLRIADGGLGVGSLHLRHHAAYLGSWAACLPHVLQRLSVGDGQRLQASLPGGDDVEVAPGSIGASLRQATTTLATAGVAAQILPGWDGLVHRPGRHVQRVLTHARMRVVRSSLLASADAAGQARLRSCAGSGAGAFLTCAASDVSRTELMDGAFRFAVSWRLGRTCFASDLSCRVARDHGRRGFCGAALDNMGDHAAVCGCGGLKILRHSRLVTCLRGILRESGVTVAPTEVMVPAWRTRSGGSSRLEIAYTFEGIRRHVDVILRHPRARAFVTRAAEQDGFAASFGEQEKFDRYPAIPHAGLEAVQPFGMETFGRLGREASSLLRSARRRIEERVGIRGGNWLGAAMHNRWLAQLNVALHLGMWDSVASCLGIVGMPTAVAEGIEGANLAWAAVPFAH